MNPMMSSSSRAEHQRDEDHVDSIRIISSSAEFAAASPTNEILQNEDVSTSPQYKYNTVIDGSIRGGTSIAPTVIEDLGQINDQFTQEGSAATKSPQSSPLETELRSALRKYKGEEKHEFLPIDALERAIQVEKIREELCRWNDVQHANDMADNVMGIRFSKKERDSRSKRKIFAILGLMEKARKIQQFIALNVCDDQLPFKFQKGPEGRFIIQDRNGHPVHLDMFNKQSLCEGFRDHQWEVLVPSFELSSNSAQEIQHHDLNLYERLPFEKSEQVYEGEPELAQGGFAEVWRVKIHPAHHNLLSASALGKETIFAVKRLHRNEESYKQGGEPDNYEAQVLKRLNDLEDKHIIRLLGTFSHDNHFHLIFPWANGNLQYFWKIRQHNTTARTNGSLARWLCEQMIGLSNALNKIHNMQRLEGKAQSAPFDFNSRNHGRHGDIKPENILWFKNDRSGDQESLGILKLADFGLADFHSERSKSGANAKGVTQTYQAPEIDVMGVVSQKYDMWSLGCVLLQFAVWYVDGWQGIDDFSKRRSDETAFGIKMDKFYDVRSDESSAQNDRRAWVKPSVASIQMYLTEHSKTPGACCDFIMEVIDLAQDGLLRMNPKNRADCDTIVQKLTVISENCSKDSQYFTRRSRSVIRRPTDLSELSSSKNYSENKRNTEQNSGGAGADASESTRQLFHEQVIRDENVPSAETSVPSNEERTHPVRMWGEYLARKLWSCLGFEDN